MSLTLTNEIIRYILEQCSGVVIALVLIIRIETKLDSVIHSINQLTYALRPHLRSNHAQQHEQS